MCPEQITPQEVLAALQAVPPLSPGAAQLLRVVGQGDFETSDIVNAIETDSGLTVNVLRVVNSAAMGLRREIPSLKEAVAFLGDTKIIGIALTSSGGAAFNKELAGYEGSRGDLGRHCLWVATAARELAALTRGRVDTGVAFTAGLLHDIGKAVISDFLVTVVPERMAGSPWAGDHLAAEQSHLGTDHAVLGCALGERWEMPGSLVEGIRHHHNPGEAPEDHMTMAYVIHLADMLAQLQGVGTGRDDLHYVLDQNYPDHVPVDEIGLEKVALATTLDYAATAEALFGARKDD